MVLAFAVSVHAAHAEEARREPQFPLKTSRAIYTDKAIRQARDNIARYASAKELADKTIAAADAWLEWDNAALRALIPTADVPRAFNVGTAGCPTCGKKIYEKGGTYPWKLDLKKPFKVTCPVCGGAFPDNDFRAYYDSGFKDKQSLEGRYSDDGWGWLGPDGDAAAGPGQRYWFVAYANHWTLHSHIVPALTNLRLAYLLSGDVRYAHKAVAILDRIAEVYPGMDYHDQSRYGQLTDARGGRYPGKLVNCIWACGNLTSMARAYDAVWETIGGAAELQAALGKTGEAIRANIEANLLEEGIDGVLAREIRGNFGMHQRALVYAALARQHGKTEEWVGSVLDRSGGSAIQSGLNYALYNLVYRDGLPYETSPGYNSGWVRAISTIAEALKGTQWDVYTLPKARSLYDGILDMVTVRQFTPAVGDSSNVYGGSVASASVFQPAYQAYGDARYLARLAKLDAVGDGSFPTYESLFDPPIEAEAAQPGPPPSRLLDGYGMGILNNAQDTVSASLYYGFKGGHGHFDRLNFEIFAHGRPMMPDTGYPDFMNGYVPGIYTWSKNTIAHNTVTVDAQRQLGNRAGTVHLFADGDFARVIDVEAPETYPQCGAYRRCLVMVDVDDDRAYFVDFFTVAGGSQHDYSLHGPPGSCTVMGGEWNRQEKGTLAGENVELAEIYDDPARGAEGFDGTYYGYTGSGFQHLFNVQRHVAGAWCVHYAHEKDPEALLRLRILPEPGTDIILADAQVSPVKHKQLLKYVIARRQGDELESRYLGLCEPFRGGPLIDQAQRLDLNEGQTTAAVVRRTDGQTDVILYNPGGAEVKLDEFGAVTRAKLLVATVDVDGRPVRACGADAEVLSWQGTDLSGAPAPAGTVVSVRPHAREVDVRLDDPDVPIEMSSLLGRVAHFENDTRRTAHPIEAARLASGVLTLTTRDHLLVGRLRVTAVDPQALRTGTGFVFAPVYDGTYVADAACTAAYPITGVRSSAVQLADPLPEGHAFEADADAWIVSVGPGDRLAMPRLLQWRRGAAE